MRTVTITRKKSLLGMLMPYFVYVGYIRKEVDPCDPDDIWEFPEQAEGRLANGETAAFQIKDEKCAIVIWAKTWFGAASSPAYYLEEGTADVELELTTRYSWTNASHYTLQPQKGGGEE